MINIFNISRFVTEFLTLSFGGGGGGNSTGTTYTSNIPEYAKPYYQELLKQTGKETFKTDAAGNVTGIKDYVPYEGERLAEQTDQQKALAEQYANLQTPGGFADAAAGTGYGQNLGYGAAATGIASALNYNPSTFTSDRVSATPLEMYQMTAPKDVQSATFNQAAADYYSNPYTQNVTNTALREAQLQGQLQKKKLMLGAIGRGTFGGAGSTLMQAEQNRGLNQQLSDIQYKGAADAYTNAQAQFQADQARRMQADLANQAAGLTTEQANLKAKLETQGLSSEQALKAALANQTANLDTQKLTEQSKQFGAGLNKDIGLAGLTAGLEASKTQGALAVAQQTAELERLKAQSSNANEQQAYQQKIDDLKYKQAMEAQDWQKKQLEFYSNILHGTSGALGSTQVNYTPQASPISQLAGLGIAGLGLAKAT
jgi:hypothetical protein